MMKRFFRRKQRNGGLHNPIASNLLFKLSKCSQNIKPNPITSLLPLFPPVKNPKPLATP
jgi:hypothetical protein